MTDLITEARGLLGVMTADIADDGYFECREAEHNTIKMLCDALEKAGTEIERLKAEANADYSEIADTMAGLMGEIERLREAQRWIPVSERLPTERGYYLVVVKRIAPDELGGNNTRVKIMRWTGEDWRYPVHIPEWINEAITETVTHWQPLPKPPRGDKL